MPGVGEKFRGETFNHFNPKSFAWVVRDCWGGKPGLRRLTGAPLSQSTSSPPPQKKNRQVTKGRPVKPRDPSYQRLFNYIDDDAVNQLLY